MVDADTIRNDENFFADLSDKQQNRFVRALDEDITILPAGPNLYDAFSQKDDEEKHHGISLPRRSNEFMCGCYDFYFRLVDEDGDHSRCKHIWKLLIDIRGEKIPGPGEHPYTWLAHRLTQELTEATGERATDLYSLRESLLDRPSYSVDYHTVFKRWFELIEE